MHRAYRTRHPNATPGWGPAPGWGQSFPGWSPLVDHGPLPLRAASAVARWANQGRLEHRRTPGSHRRYDPELIDQLARDLTYRP